VICLKQNNSGIKGNAFGQVRGFVLGNVICLEANHFLSQGIRFWTSAGLRGGGGGGGGSADDCYYLGLSLAGGVGQETRLS
jgi:hypothetical protein